MSMYRSYRTDALKTSVGVFEEANWIPALPPHRRAETVGRSVDSTRRNVSWPGAPSARSRDSPETHLVLPSVAIHVHAAQLPVP